VVQRLLEAGFIDRLVFQELDQSMAGGGGPACLRLRLPLTQQEMASLTPGVLLDAARLQQLEAWVDRHYRDELTPDALADPQLLQETRQALDALTQLLGLGAIYSFQRRSVAMSPPLMDEHGLHATAPVLLRPARAADAAALVQLAELLDTMNLPRDPETIASIIAESAASFARLAHPEPAHTDTAALKGTYTLVALQGERLLGTASLLSHHGTPQDPHYYLRVIEQTFHSKQLNTERHLHLLRLERDEVPWTELGGLVVHSEARGKGRENCSLPPFAPRCHAPGPLCQRLRRAVTTQRGDGSNAFWMPWAGR
jgi:hypothetical protein